MSTNMISVGGLTVDAANVTVPDNRDFRNAWQLEGAVIEVDMNKARDIHRDLIRIVRKEAFAVNDINLQDAMIDGDADAKATGVARRDALRDAPADPAIDAATTPEELSAVWPAGLSARGVMT